MTSRVSLIALDRYEDFPALLAALERALSPFGGMESLVHPGDRVLLKANLLAPARPEEAVTTHPQVLRAVIRLVKKAGAAEVLVGDGPGVGQTEENMRVCGLLEVCQEEGATPAPFRETTVFHTPENAIGKSLELTSWLTQVDVVISLPKLKTHVQMGYTGALKNQYGLIPGGQKGEYHFRLQNRDRLADLMIDINRTARVKLAVLDAIVAMEGPGPHGGTPRKVGALVVGTDLAAVDVVGCELIGLPPGEYPLLQAARRGNFGATSLREVEVEGDSLESLKVKDFQLVKTPVNVLRILPLPGFLLKWLRGQVAPTPFIQKDKCIKCGKCQRGCPAKPAAISPGYPEKGGVKKELCIRCYCCHEFCPVKAIALKRPWLDRLLHWTSLASAGARLLGHLVALFHPSRKKQKPPASSPREKG
ncbi:MAG: DUF362 domain-containing protein [Oligosphaeraceae bacterium]